MSIQQALALAMEYHGSQRRKTPLLPGVAESRAPYMGHLMESAGIVWALGADEDEVAATLLHDIVEDTDCTLAIVEQRCGKRVASLVRECTEIGTEGNGPKPPWEDRKLAYLAHLRTASDDAVWISLAEKLQSLRGLSYQVQDYHLEAYKDLVSGSLENRRERTLWFHTMLAQVYGERVQRLREEGNLLQERRCAVLLRDFNRLLDGLYNDVA